MEVRRVLQSRVINCLQARRKDGQMRPLALLLLSERKWFVCSSLWERQRRRETFGRGRPGKD